MESPTSAGRAQTEIDMSEEEEMQPSPVAHDDVSSMARELTKDAKGVTNYINRLRTTGPDTMCRIPAEVANDGGDFEPKLISIGPYHSKKEALLPMQDVKLKYLSDLLHRSVESNKVKKYMEAIKEQLLTEEEKYWEFHACGISNEEFLKMLVLDGCFLVELLLKHADILTPSLLGIDDIHLLRHDLMLIENQVPFSILKLIYRLTEYNHTDLVGLDKKCTLFDLAIFYLDNKEKNIGAYKEKENVYHLLHLLYMCRLDQLETIKTRQKSISDRFYDLMLGDYTHLFKPSNLLPGVMFILAVLFLKPLKKILKFVGVGLVYYVIIGVESLFTRRNKSSPYYQKSSVIPTVEELNYAGMSFKTRSSNPYEMKFYRRDESLNGGSMEINDNFFIEFENMLFYEQIYWAESFPISTYTVYMSNLVKTEIDVHVLRQHGILIYHEGKEITSFFGKHRSWLLLPETDKEYLREQFKSLNKFCSRDHNKRRAKLMKDYFKCHW